MGLYVKTGVAVSALGIKPQAVQGLLKRGTLRGLAPGVDGNTTKQWLVELDSLNEELQQRGLDEVDPKSCPTREVGANLAGELAAVKAQLAAVQAQLEDARYSNALERLRAEQAEKDKWRHQAEEAARRAEIAEMKANAARQTLADFIETVKDQQAAYFEQIAQAVRSL
ncbi:MAG TPA: hypothetical protein VHD87_15105 [Acidimicrobiales bacterium]|nr:hypothetical protein [Acidimicrobiales bacterium]